MGVPWDVHGIVIKNQGDMNDISFGDFAKRVQYEKYFSHPPINRTSWNPDNFLQRENAIWISQS